jgi:hypothetical protein
MLLINKRYAWGSESANFRKQASNALFKVFTFTIKQMFENMILTKLQKAEI